MRPKHRIYTSGSRGSQQDQTEAVRFSVCVILRDCCVSVVLCALSENFIGGHATLFTKIQHYLIKSNIYLVNTALLRIMNSWKIYLALLFVTQLQVL